MGNFSSTLRVVLLIAGLSMLIGGLAAIGVGMVALGTGQQEPELTVVSGPAVEIPKARFFGGSVMVYTATPPESDPLSVGCRLIDADGDMAPSTRVGSFDHALGEPLTVGDDTWYPFTEVDLTSSTATLECPGNVLTRAAVSAPSTFGGSSTGIGAFAVGTGLLVLVFGGAALMARRWVRG